MPPLAVVLLLEAEHVSSQATHSTKASHGGSLMSAVQSPGKSSFTQWA